MCECMSVCACVRVCVCACVPVCVFTAQVVEVSIDRGVCMCGEWGARSLR